MKERVVISLVGNLIYAVAIALTLIWFDWKMLALFFFWGWGYIMQVREMNR